MKITGGKKFERELAKIADQLTPGDKPTLKIGFLSNAKYPDGTPVAVVAAVHEFGSKKQNIPPRPFFRTMIAKHKNEWPSLVRSALINKSSTREALMLVGQVIKEELQASIRQFSGHALHWRTVRRKGHDKQLIDTGHLLNSVDFEVE